MKKIIGLVLALVLLTSVFAVLPVMAEDEATITDVAVHLDQGITLVYKLSDGGYEYVPIAAKEMNNVAGPDGYNEDKFDSVKGYVTRLLAETDDEITEDLVNAMLNYGAAAQNYFNYQTDNLVGTPVTDTAALVAAGAPEIVVNDESGIYLGVSLVLEGTLKLRFYFKGNGLEVECDNNTPDVTNVGDNCYVDVPFMPYDIAEPVTVTTGTTSVTYAPINYLKAKANDADEKLTTMVASIYAYSVAARAYYIEYNCEHKGIILNTVVVPTLFTEGLAQGACPLCGDEVSEKLEKTEAEMNAFTSIDNEEDWFYKSAKVGDILGDKNLYGEDGVDIFVEFSVLLNNTMDMFANTNFTLPGVWLNEKLTGTNHGDGFYYLYLTKGGMPKGAFEMWNSRCNKVENGYISGPTCNGAGDDLYVGNFDGWHRIGVQMHFEAFVEDGEAYYVNTVTLYIDGAKAHSYKMRTDDDDTQNNSVLTAIEAIVENGQIVGYKNRTDRYINIFRYTPNLKDDYDGETGYFPVADCYVTAGNGFVVTVTPVANPEAQDFTQDGATLSGKQYFAIKDLSDCYAGNHSWTENATVDTPATCTTDGQKSIKCTICGEIKEGSVVVIPATHTWGGYTVDTIATAFSEGLSRWTCSVCGDIKTEPIEKTTPRFNEHKQTSTREIITSNYDQIKDIIGDSHFYPTEADPDGNDLLIELSILLNSSMNNYIKETTNLTLGGIHSDEKLTSGRNTHWFYFKNSGNYEQGSFELSNSNALEYIYGPTCEGADPANHLVVNGFDGWHRFGIRYHQNTVRDGDTFTYSMTVTLYIDGVRVHEYVQKCDDEKLLLYKAKVEDGEIKYTEYTDKYAGIFKFNCAVTDPNNPAYFIYADHKVSCADDFYLNVSPVNDPAAKDYTHNGKTFSGKEYFTVNGLKDCDIDNHSWADKATTDTAATCTVDGSKSIKCTVCGAVKPDSTTTIPAAHAWGGYTTDVEATCTENGQKSIKCLTCKETKPGSVETIESAGQHVLGADAVITSTATVFTEGVKTGTCTACNKTVSVVFEAMTKANMNAVTTTTKDKYYIYDSKNIGEIIDGQKLYPTTENPNGKDILVEFSILLNGTMDMLGSSNFTLPGVYKSDNATTGHDKGDGLYFLYLTKGGMPKGAFEIWNSRQKEVAKVDSEKSYLYGPDCDAQNLYVGNFDGWHRIGVRIHSEAVAGANSATYINTVSLYIDGVLVQAYSYIADDNCSSHASDKRLFSIIWANKNLTEYDNYDSRYITAYRYTTYLLEAYAGETAYIPIADLYYSCVDAGGDFVLDVSPVANPEAKDFVQDGVTLSGREYFTVNNGN